MSVTSASLLDRLCTAPDESAWTRFVDMYTPLIRSWLRRQAQLHESDVEDLVQEVLTRVVRRIPSFEHNQRVGAFRTWLRSITSNCLREAWRKQRLRPRPAGSSDFNEWLEALEDPTSGLSRQWDLEHDRHVGAQLLKLLEPQFEAKTWRAFVGVAVDGRSADEVAAGLDMTVNAVFIAKSRVLSRLRAEARGLVE
jgi:RNA polymerase sigma-70 factor (ECF subfamily)